jgi:hypothetical protein
MSLDLPPLIKRFYYLYMSKKNNLTFNNLDYQIPTPKLYNLNYNLNYIIYKVKQTELSSSRAGLGQPAGSKEKKEQ